MEKIISNDLIDLAAVKLSELPPIPPNSFPIFMNIPNDISDLPVGHSLCRTGFPFHEINATFNEPNGTFTLAPNTLPITRFPNDCILTRGLIMIDETSKKSAKFIETSTPGLRGQSGGPIFDTEGRIWGIQSRTNHLSLGFSPMIKDHSKNVLEHQFLNVGVGVYVSEVIKFLHDNNIYINVSSDDI